MKQNERFALEIYLEDFPESQSFDSILDTIREGNINTIKVCEAYERCDKHKLINIIVTTAEELENRFFPVVELVSVIDRDTVAEILLQQLQRSPSKEEIERVCSFLDSDFSFQLPKKISDAITCLNIKK